MVSVIPEEHLNQQLISRQFPHCSSTQLLWEVMFTANLQNTFGSRWATSHTLFDEHAFLQSGKTICRRMLSFCILLLFEMSPSSASLPQICAKIALNSHQKTTESKLLGCNNTLWHKLWSWLGESFVNESQLQFFFFKPNLPTVSLWIPSPLPDQLAKSSRLRNSVEASHRSFPKHLAARDQAEPRGQSWILLGLP